MNQGMINDIKIRNGQHPLNVLATVENESDAWIFLSTEVMDKLSKETFYCGRCKEEEYMGYKFMCFHESADHPKKALLFSYTSVNGWYLYEGSSYENEKKSLPRIPKKIFYISF